MRRIPRHVFPVPFRGLCLPYVADSRRALARTARKARGPSGVSHAARLGGCPRVLLALALCATSGEGARGGGRLGGGCWRANERWQISKSERGEAGRAEACGGQADMFGGPVRTQSAVINSSLVSGSCRLQLDPLLVVGLVVPSTSPQRHAQPRLKDESGQAVAPAAGRGHGHRR